jgi:hypothetical protein
VKNEKIMRELKKLEKRQLAKICNYFVPKMNKSESKSVSIPPQPSESNVSSDTAIITLRTSSMA